METLQMIFADGVLKNVYYYSICIFVFALFFKYIFKKLDKDIFLKEGIPTLRLKWYNLMGHLIYLPHGPAYDQLAPANTYLLQTIEGVRTLLKNDSIFCIWMANMPYIMLHKADAVEELLKGTATMEKAFVYSKLHRWIGTGLLTSKGPKWKSRRKILTPSFHFDILKDFLPVLNEKSKILIDILRKETCKEWVDITEPITLCSLDIICETTLGVDIDAQRNGDSEYVQAVSRVSSITMERMFNPRMIIDFIFYLTKTGRQYKKDVEILHNFTKNVIQKKKKLFNVNDVPVENEVRRKRQALMDLLLYHHMYNQDFTEEDIREEVDTFAFEGHDTTSAGLSWCLYLVGLHPEVQKKIHDELDKIFDDDDRHITVDDLKDMHYLECVIKEGQRLYPSVPIIARKITKDFTLCGRQIKSGIECMILIYGLHRDADVFPNPEVFNPERFFPENSVGRHPYAYVPFSAGPRNCIGQRFAMMELKVVLASVFRQFSVRSLEQRDKLVPAADLILRPSRTMKLKIMLRQENRE